MKKPPQAIDIQSFFKKYDTDAKLYNWLLSDRFESDYNLLLLQNRDQEKAKILIELRNLRNSQFKSIRYLRWIRVAMVVAVVVAIGLDLAFAGGIGTLITFAIANPTYIALAGAAAASAMYVMPKIIMQAAGLFYKNSETKIFEHALSINGLVNKNGNDSSILFKNMQRGWIFSTRRRNAIGALIGSALKGFSSTHQIVPAEHHVSQLITPKSSALESRVFDYASNTSQQDSKSSQKDEFFVDFIDKLKDVRKRNEQQNAERKVNKNTKRTNP